MSEDQVNTERPKNISFEVLTQAQLKEVVCTTLNEEVLQNLAAIKMTTPLIPEQREKSLEEAATAIESLIDVSMAQIRAIQKILKQDPSLPVPLDNRYVSAGGKPVLALDLIIQHPQK